MTFWIVVHQLYFWIYKQNIWGMVTYSIIWKIVIVLLHIWSIKELDEERCDSIMQYQI